MPSAGLYVHIPFCRAKCAYCDFVSYAGLEALHAAYIQALEREIAQQAPSWAGFSFDSLFIGGGTPTLLAPAQLAAILDACRRWGEWHEREADYAPACNYHDIHVDTNEKVARRKYWAMDDGVQGRLAAKFGNARWLELYHQKVRVLVDHAIRLENMPAQQGRHFYWDTSLVHPILEGLVPAEDDPRFNRERVLTKFREYTEWMLGLRLADGMMAFKYERPGKPDPEGRYQNGGCAGDGAATAMGARMCWLLWQATGEAKWCEEALPMLAWMKEAQFPPEAPDRMAGGIPFCHWLLDPQTQQKFDFKRIISTSFSVMALAEWLAAVAQP